MSEKYKVDIDLSGPADAAEMQRLGVRMFCESMTPQRFTYFMRDDQLRSEMRGLIQDVPLVREVFAEQQPAFLGLIEVDPPTTLHLASLDGQSLY